ncbi:hypothetical protein [Zestomonas thermotolerans]|mgnify:CR=1 FL=1|jgi:hypothetical protein|uniref:hypothetical protein n=1 Tax=Zestomonas thermotolerans TaxID=157784 RepID=UPI0004B7B88C|nr:hypothetical protein [Pseudomonas thermotolerans]
MRFPLNLDVPAIARARRPAPSASRRSSRSSGELALFADPFGHGFCLLQWRGRDYDQAV